MYEQTRFRSSLARRRRLPLLLLYGDILTFDLAAGAGVLHVQRRRAHSLRLPADASRSRGRCVRTLRQQEKVRRRFVPCGKTTRTTTTTRVHRFLLSLSPRERERDGNRALLLGRQAHFLLLVRVEPLLWFSGILAAYMIVADVYVCLGLLTCRAERLPPPLHSPCVV